VGSSWRDAKVAEQLYRELFPGAEILVYDPVEIQNLGIEINPETDLVIGMSWSGATASMVKLFQRLANNNVMILTAPGPPGAHLAR
jgi:DNA-binding MurR/RpiR family transcriptional regulator